MTPRRIGAVLAVVATVLVLINQRDVGIARDETVYFTAGDRYADWWVKALTFRDHATIAQTFGGAFGGEANPEHPPLLKLASGLSHRWLPFAGELTAYRFPSAVLHGVCTYLVFVFALELWGLAAAVLAALCLIALPRALFHAGLDCFDAPTMTLWFATVYAYWRCLDGRKWPWQVGVAWGLALATKHTALFLPFALGAHLIAISIRAKRIEHWRVIVSLAVLGPLTLFVLWPWLWSAPIAHVRDWLAFHMHHVHYNFEYLGANWNAPPFPWHVAIVTTLFTVPAATLVAAAIGACVMRTRGGTLHGTQALPSVLLLVSAAASIGPFFLGTTPIFGAEKHWMPILPTLCIMAGIGAAWAARKAGDAIGRPRTATIAVGGLLVLAGASEVIAAEPYALTWYSALAGGDAGGADLGMNRQFWGVAARGVLPEIAAQPPGPVYTHDASPAWGWYQRLGELPKGYPDAGHEAAGIAASKLAIVIHEKHFNRHDYMIWKAYGTVQPIFVLRANGVPIVSLYKRP